MPVPRTQYRVPRYQAGSLADSILDQLITRNLFQTTDNNYNFGNTIPFCDWYLPLRSA